MKNERADKIKLQLNSVESELINDLRRCLAIGKVTGADYFSDSIWNPNQKLVFKLLQKAKESLDLRNSLCMNVTNSPGQLYIQAYEEAANTADAHRRGPKKLAKWLEQKILSYELL